MKRVGNLFEKIADYNNLKLAHQKARRKKTHYSEVKQVDRHEDYYLQRLQRMLLQKTFKKRVAMIDRIRNKRSVIMSYYGWVKVSDSKILWNKYLPLFELKIAA